MIATMDGKMIVLMKLDLNCNTSTINKLLITYDNCKTSNMHSTVQNVHDLLVLVSSILSSLCMISILLLGWFLYTTCINSKTMSTNDTDYSCHIKAV